MLIDNRALSKLLVIAVAAMAVVSGVSICYYYNLSSMSHPEYRIVTDFEGREVAIPYEVKRAVVLEGYEIVYALGAWDKVVGLSKYAKDNPILKAADEKYNLSLSNIPSPGSSFSVNLEELVNENPDVVIAYSSKQMKDILPQIEALNISVVLISLSDLDDLYKYVRLLGDIFNAKDEAEQIIQRMKDIMNLATSRTADIPMESRLKMIHLWSKKNKVTGGLGVTNTYINLSGCINPAAYLDEKYAEVSVEEISIWDPDVIVIWGWAKYTAEEILNEPQRQSISAVQNRKVYKYPKGLSTWSPAACLLVLRMAMLANPDRFGDINFEETTDRFFTDTYGIQCPLEW
jgi:iron complex transport system substrate-binding protein